VKKCICWCLSIIDMSFIFYTPKIRAQMNIIWNLLNHRASNMHTKPVSSLTTLLHYYVSKHKDRYDHLNGSSFHTANRNLTYLWNSQSECNWSPLMWKIAALLVFLFVIMAATFTVETWVLVAWQIYSMYELL